ncbi:SirB2 family protein [Marinobacter halotolerans]|uniref:SirB2 family protein n=1 Tax=Marinobacter halotolerans TaxID=1569211 RepID=UPI001247D336|nr:SirB2 family protein [Marinobacter halotolerans]
MSSYLILKNIHMTAAYLTVVMFALRLLLDLVGKPEWRRMPVRWVPHVNDTILLVAAVGLLFVTPWSPFAHGWLMAKIVLLLGYIAAGVFALKENASFTVRLIAAALALVQITAIFHLATAKPF